MFTLFPTLPLELRRMVWTYALPKGRRVRFFTVSLYNHRPNPLAIPAIAQTNYESRKIFLDHYTVLCHSDKPRIYKPRKPVRSPGFPWSRLVRFFDPSADTLYMNSMSLMMVPRGLERWMTYLRRDKHFCNTLGKITKLEACKFYWCAKMYGTAEGREYLAEWGISLSVLRFFPGLKEIWIVCDGRWTRRGPLPKKSKEAMDDFAAYVKDFYDEKKREGRALAMPKLIFT